ncbi:MAG: hypothetical protein KAT46_00485 [Deltaproteobacteria bacterium]|nr:hypothetical protein [Deltaproteobacteria bacterium]
MKKYIFLFLVIIFTTHSYAGNIPEQEDYIVDANVFFDRVSEVYEYNYTLINPKENKSELRRLRVYIPNNSSGKVLSWEGLVNGEECSRYFLKKTKIKITAVGINAPKSWTCGLGFSKDDIGFVIYGSLENTQILPGGSLEGLIITSYGIPGIRDAILEPDFIFDEKDLPEEDIDYYIENGWEYLDKIYKSVAFNTKTIGPVAPPLVFNATDFINHLIDLKHQAQELGWIKAKGGDGIIQALDQKLDNAKAAIAKGNTRSASKILKAFIKQVEAQSCKTHDDCKAKKHLSPEAYALLKYNAEYLLDNL